MILRPIQASDFPAMIRLLHEFATFQQTPEKFENSLERMEAEQDFFKGLVAVEQGQIIGFATFYFCYFSWSGKGLFLDDLYVLPEERGKGIGGQLMQAVIALAKDNGCHKLRWQVSHWNKGAIGYYESLGAKFDQTEMNCELQF